MQLPWQQEELLINGHGLSPLNFYILIHLLEVKFVLIMHGIYLYKDSSFLSPTLQNLGTQILVVYQVSDSSSCEPQVFIGLIFLTALSIWYHTNC